MFSAYCGPGDIVVIFYGCRPPFILRSVSTGYRLVAECYVHGIMRGEAMEQILGIEYGLDASC